MSSGTGALEGSDTNRDAHAINTATTKANEKTGTSDKPTVMGAQRKRARELDGDEAARNTAKKQRLANKLQKQVADVYRALQQDRAAT